jgi:hypothetical protein
MVQFLKIEKNGTVKEEQVNSTEELYKKCNLRKAEGFNKICDFIDGSIKIELWGRMSGRMNIKNVYVFPNNIDSNIYGTCGLVFLVNNKLVDLSVDKWDEICVRLNNTLDNVDSDTESIIKTVDDKQSDQDSEIVSVNDSSEYMDSELKEDEYLYSSEEEEEEEEEDEEDDSVEDN